MFFFWITFFCGHFVLTKYYYLEKTITIPYLPFIFQRFFNLFFYKQIFKLQFDTSYLHFLQFTIKFKINQSNQQMKLFVYFSALNNT